MTGDVKMDDGLNIGKLISFISRQNHRYIARRLEGLGLGSGQHPYLMTLYRKDGVNQDELSRHVGLDKATTTRAVRKLVEGGYVLQEPDPSDGRSYLIRLTDKGNEIKPIVKGTLRDLVVELSSGLSEEEVEALHGLLLKVAKNSSRITGHEMCSPSFGGK